jgi:predicted  nucleic acid-binding Zn-ribbon protein
MHPDLPKLLELQAKDRRLADLGARLEALEVERTVLDAALDRIRSEIHSATRTANDFARRRDETASKLDTQRSNQEKRRVRLEAERNPRLAAQLMADVELARSILAQEESEWMRLADDATTRAGAVTEIEGRLAALEAEQSEARASFAARLADLQAEMDAAKAEREASAAQLDRTLRTRYDRLRSSRRTEILVPANKAICTACYTAIPSSRLGRLEAEGLLLEGCEMCGAIIYVQETVA